MPRNRYYCGAVPVAECVDKIDAALALAQQQSGAGGTSADSEGGEASVRSKGLHAKAREAVVARDITPFEDLHG